MINLKEREELFKQQRIERGWDDSDTWSLDHKIAEFVLPRLKRFKELNNGYPCREENMTFELWNDILDSIIYSFEIIINEFEEKNDVDWVAVEIGLNNFGKYFRDLWW
jgi:hypothetical protein